MKTVTPGFPWIVIGLLALGAGLPMSAYQQGSYFLFDIQEDTSTEGGAGGRIALSASVFDKGAKPDAGIARKKKRSEFESEISSFKPNSTGSVSTGIEILDKDEDGVKKESTFGEGPPASSGFFFTY